MRAAARDYYELLDVQPTASAAEIRRAYFKLAKIYHPDRQVEHSDQNTEMFLAVQEAYDVLSDAKRRLDYDQEHADGVADASSEAPAAGSAKTAAGAQDAPSDRSPAARPSERKGPTLEQEKDARMAFMKAENCLEQGNHEKADRIMRAVVRTVPENPDYLSLAGYLQALEGGDRLHTARDFCQKAVEAQPFNALFLARLGFVYEEVGLRSRANHYYEEALARDPKQPLAASRRRGAGPSASTGFLSAVKRLFGR